MEIKQPHLTTQKSFYVEISHAKHRAELVTDNGKALAEHLKATTGERVAALEAMESVATGPQSLGGAEKAPRDRVLGEGPEVSRAKVIEADLEL